jgi:IS5 family transposase
LAACHDRCGVKRTASPVQQAVRQNRATLESAGEVAASAPLQALYSVRSERLLMEQLDYNLLFRWFVGLNMDDPVWDVTVFTKNRERLLDGDIAEAFFQAVLQQARERSLLSDEHFTVDGTLLEAWASLKSFQRKDAKNAVPPDDPGNATVDFHGERRSNETHQSKTDPDAKMARKARARKPS